MGDSPQRNEPENTFGDNSRHSELSACRCGHTKSHYSVSAEAEYTTWGWFCNLFGITARPKRLKYRCRNCNSVFDETDDEAVLDDHV